MIIKVELVSITIYYQLFSRKCWYKMLYKKKKENRKKPKILEIFYYSNIKIDNIAHTTLRMSQWKCFALKQFDEDRL